MKRNTEDDEPDDESVENQAFSLRLRVKTRSLRDLIGLEPPTAHHPEGVPPLWYAAQIYLFTVLMALNYVTF
jgi:hypothetical protein